jgi:carboxypeptidase C (cathepsin A)
MYIRNTLNYKTDFKYNMFGPVRPWDNSNDATGENLRQAMAQNPYLNVMVQSGYYDGAVIILMQNTIWQMDPGSAKRPNELERIPKWPYDVFKKTGFRNCK